MEAAGHGSPVADAILDRLIHNSIDEPLNPYPQQY